jgi:hypothetical protein
MLPDVLPQASAGAVVPSVDVIFHKYIQALGGDSALSKLTSYVGKGTSTTFGADQINKAEIFAKAPDKYVTIVHQREGDMVRTYDGRDAWVVLPLTVTGEYLLTGSAAEGGKLDGEMAFPGNIKAFFNTWRVSYPANIDGHDVNVVQGSGPLGFIATFYFDKQTNLLTHGPLCHLGRRPGSNTNRLLRLSSGGRRYDAVQTNVRMGKRARGVRADRNRSERPR